MFWAVTIESGKRYSQIPEDPFWITMASLEPRENVPENKQASLMVEHGGKEFLLCTLEYDRVMQVNMNLKFNKGEQAFFFINGEGTIHLSGQLLTNDKPAKKEMCSIMDYYNQPSTSGGITSTPLDDDDDEEDDDESDDEDDDDDEEEEVGVGTDRLLALDDSDEEDSQDWNPQFALAGAQSKKKKKSVKQEVGDENEVILCSESDEEEDDDDDDDEEEEDSDVLLNEASDLEDDDDEEEEESSKKRKKSILFSASSSKRLKPDEKMSRAKKAPIVSFGNAKKSKGNDATHDDPSDSDEGMNSSIGHTPMRKSNLVSSSAMNESVKSNQGASSNNSGKVSVAKPVSETFSHALPSGVEYEDVRLGNGPVAKNGKYLHLYYIGKLQNGQIFDAVKEGKGKPFAMRLGKNDVIAGWEEGLLGMRVGGKRRLKIPPQMGYGNKKMPGIPPNSTLYFTVELKAVK